MFKLCFFYGSVSFLGSQDTPLQPEQMLVQTMPYCLHVQFYRAQSLLLQYVTIFNSSGGATCLVISIGIIPCFVSCQPHFKGSSSKSPLHSCIWWLYPKHLLLCSQWVHELLLRNLESILTFSYDIYVHKAHQEFSPSCHQREEVEFFLQFAICLLCLMLMKRLDFWVFDFSKKK